MAMACDSPCRYSWYKSDCQLMDPPRNPLCFRPTLAAVVFLAPLASFGVRVKFTLVLGEASAWPSRTRRGHSRSHSREWCEGIRRKSVSKTTGGYMSHLIRVRPVGEVARRKLEESMLSFLRMCAWTAAAAAAAA